MAMLRLITVFVFFCEIYASFCARNETIDPTISWFLKSTPFVDLSKVSGIGAKCRRDFETFLKAMDNLELWALKMHDATAKIPSGIFNGNLNQYGDFDQCLNVKSEEVQSKYCVAYLQPRSRSGVIKDLLKLVQSNEFFKSNFNDCGYRTPRFSHINWAVCIPSSCSHRDLEIGISAYLKDFLTNYSDLAVDVRVDSEMCQMKKEFNVLRFDRSTKIVIFLFTCFLIFITFCTFHDFQFRNRKNDYITAFSLIKNVEDLLNTDENPNDIQVVHGLRFLMALVLMITHKSVAVLFNPFTNRTEMTTNLANPFLLVYASAASLYTDIFLMLSGLLTTYTFFGRLQKGREIVVWRELLDRYVRIIPSIIFLILFCTFILPIIGSGPMWNLVVTSHADICRKYWWRNLLFLQNWFGYNSICLTNTHHVGIDFQLFTVATLLTIALWKWPRRGLKAVVTLAVLSTLARFFVTIKHELSIHIFFGIELSKIAEVADRMYIIPPFRFSVYAIGMLLGYTLRKYKDFQPTKTQRIIGWTVGFGTFFVTILSSIRMNFPDYKYDKVEAAFYAAFAPILWCGLSTWIIFISEKGSQSIFVQVFRIKFQRIFTKISYAIYLTQFPIFFFNVGKVRNAEYYEFIKIMYDFEELTSIVVCSVILHLFVEAPFNNLRKLLFDKKPIATKKID